MLKDIGVQYIIIGYFECCIYYKEFDELIVKKFVVLKEQGLILVLCIGEIEVENEVGKIEEVCVCQIDVVLKIQGAAVFEGVVIVYEFVWVIGIGKFVILVQVQVVYKFICDYIVKVDVNIVE